MTWYNLIGVFLASFFTLAFLFELHVSKGSGSYLLCAILASIGFTLAFV